MDKTYVIVEMTMDDYYNMCKFSDKYFEMNARARERRRNERDTKNQPYNPRKPISIIVDTRSEPSEKYIEMAAQQENQSKSYK